MNAVLNKVKPVLAKATDSVHRIERAAASGRERKTTGGVAAARHRLLNIWVNDLSPQALMERLDAQGGVVFTLNPDHLWHLQRNRDFLKAYRSADFITVDSHYLRLAMRFLGRTVRHRVTGSDFTPAYCEHLSQLGGPLAQAGVFFFGAEQGVAQQAQARINEHLGQRLVVGAHGPSMNFVNDAEEIESALAMIRASGAAVLIVGLGAPKQEIFIAQVRERLPSVQVILGVGATVDYMAGTGRRAPAWMQRCGLEWFFRVFTEPRRYLGRYLRSAEFVVRVVLERFGLYRDPLAS
jgi:exopolysaccharide biosynthesis WecB/TagA/CpsF family protein